MGEYYFTHEKSAWEIAQCYFKMHESLLVKAAAVDTANAASSMSDSSEVAEKTVSTGESSAIITKKAIELLEGCIIFLVISLHTIESHDMMHRLKLTKLVINRIGSNDTMNGMMMSLLTLFTTQEIIPQNFPERDLVSQHPLLHTYGSEYPAYFLDLLTKRIIEHNIRVLSKSYTRIRLDRIAGLLNLSRPLIEERLAEIATSGDLYVKINRPAGIVSFCKNQSSEEILSDWGSDIGKLLHLMESTCHLIHRENMVHKI
jgi:26S proteasome regulatory subunit N5